MVVEGIVFADAARGDRGAPPAAPMWPPQAMQPTLAPPQGGARWCGRVALYSALAIARQGSHSRGAEQLAYGQFRFCKEWTLD